MDRLTFIVKTPHTTVNSQMQTPDIMLAMAMTFKQLKTPLSINRSPMFHILKCCTLIKYAETDNCSSLRAQKRRHIEPLSSRSRFQEENSCLLFVTGNMPPHKPYILLYNLRVNPYERINKLLERQKLFN